MDHKDLDVWKESVEMALEIYAITGHFPKEELYGLTSQMRRAVVSIASNIAEGAARNGDREMIQFLYIALGSLAEVETQIIIAERLGYMAHSEDMVGKLSSIKQMILGLIRHLKNKRGREA